MIGIGVSCIKSFEKCQSSWDTTVIHYKKNINIYFNFIKL